MIYFKKFRELAAKSGDLGDILHNLKLYKLSKYSLI